MGAWLWFFWDGFSDAQSVRVVAFPHGVTHERVGLACTHERVDFGGVTIERPSA